MTEGQAKEQAVQNIAQLLRNNPFKLELKVVKKPKGIKVIYEVTQEEMDAVTRMTRERRNDYV